jgi:hypothetical protein
MAEIEVMDAVSQLFKVLLKGYQVIREKALLAIDEQAAWEVIGRQFLVRFVCHFKQELKGD